MTQKTESAAEKYARLKEEQFEIFLEKSFSADSLKGVDLFEVKLPSTGMIVKCRKPDLAYTAEMGSMPMALSSQMIAGGADSDKTDEERQADNLARFQAMSETERRATIEANAHLVRYITVEPRLVVGNVNGHKNAISVNALTMADFGHLVGWAQSGGETAQGLKTFRRKRR